MNNRRRKRRDLERWRAKRTVHWGKPLLGTKIFKLLAISSMIIEAQRKHFEIYMYRSLDDRV